MRRETVDQIVAVVYAVVDCAVILVPAVALKLAADRGGMGDLDGMDLVLASAGLGVVHAVVAGSRLRCEERMAVRRADMWIAAADALVVLALAATLLPATVLWQFADEHASMANRGYPVWVLWLGVQVVAVVIAELTGRFVFWWLEPHPRRRGSWRNPMSARALRRSRRADRIEIGELRTVAARGWWRSTDIAHGRRDAGGRLRRGSDS